MSKQYAAFHITWREARNRPFFFGSDEDYGKAAADALEQKLNALAEEGWIVDRVMPAFGFTPRQTAAYTIIAFK